jgi:hypothetical protein
MRVASDLLQRALYASQLGATFAGARNVETALGYKPELTYADYLHRYERGGIAARLVDVFPDDTWDPKIEVYEDPDPTVETAFEGEIKAFVSRLGLWSIFNRADKLAQIGEYSVILIGAGGALTSELPKMRKQEDVLYLRPYGQDRARVSKLVTKSADPRFAEPELYEIDFGAVEGGETLGWRKVHWSRIIHAADRVLDDKLKGRPRLRAPWNRFDDLEKVTGGGSEAYWKRVDPGRHIKFDPTAKFSDKQIDDLLKDVEEQLAEVDHNLKRNVATQGVEIEQLQAQITGFKDAVEALIEQIAGAEGIPKRKLTGSERAEQASSQDEDNYESVIQARFDAFAEPVLIRPLVDRLIERGAFTTPKQPYQIARPESEEMNETEKASAVSSIASANAAMVAAGLGPVLTNDEMRLKFYTFDPLNEVVDDATDPGDQSTTNTNSTDTAGGGDTGNETGDTKAPPDGAPAPAGATSRSAAVDRSDDLKVVHRAADKNKGAVAALVLAMWGSVAGRIDAKAIEKNVAMGNAVGMARLVELALTEAEVDALAGFEATTRQTLADGANGMARLARKRGSFKPPRVARAAEDVQITPTGSNPAIVNFDFNRFDPRAVAYASEKSSKLIKEISPGTKAAVRSMVSDAFSKGISVNGLSRMIESRVGLRLDQLAALDRYAGKEGVSARDVERYERRLLVQRAETIARTETNRSANEGTKQGWVQAREQGYLTNEDKRIWITNMDGRERDEHHDANDQIVGFEEPFDVADGSTEPGEAPNCILPGAFISGRIIAGLKAAYSGPAREINTALGHRLRLTVNHPVLTEDGWVPCGELREGMNLLCDLSQVGIGAALHSALSAGELREIDEHDAPAAVEEVFKTLGSREGLSSSRILEVSADHLHGDARFTDGEVEIVGTDRPLRGDVGALRAERDEKLVFPVAKMEKALVSGLSSRDLSIQRIDFSSTASPGVSELSDDGGIALLDLAPLDELLLGCAADWDVPKPHASAEDIDSHAGFLRQLQERSSGLVALDQIIEILDFDFLGHVYDLQSSTGWIIANGIVISNCRCGQGLATPEDIARANEGELSPDAAGDTLEKFIDVGNLLGVDEFAAADLSEVDKLVAAADSEMERLAGKYDGLKKMKLDSLQLSPDNSIKDIRTGVVNKGAVGQYASVDGKSVINLAFGTSRRYVPDIAALGDFGVNDSVIGTLRHELGHLYYDKFMPKVAEKEWIGLWRQYGAQMASNVSRYAATSFREAFAESFAAYTHPGGSLSLPSPYQAFFKKYISKIVTTRKGAEESVTA